MANAPYRFLISGHRSYRLYKSTDIFSDGLIHFQGNWAIITFSRYFKDTAL